MQMIVRISVALILLVLAAAAVIFVPVLIPRNPDPYAAEVARLAEESRRFKEAFAAIETQIGALTAARSGDFFATPADADRALEIFEHWPDPSPPFEQMMKLLAGGVPDAADKRVILKARWRAFGNKTVLFLSFSRRLVNSAVTYKWSRVKREKLAGILLDTVQKRERTPGYLIDTLIDILAVKTAAEKKVIPAEGSQIQALTDLSLEGKKESTSLNERYRGGYYWPDFLYRDPEAVITYAPSFVISKWLEPMRPEFQAVIGLQEKLKPLLVQMRGALKSSD